MYSYETQKPRIFTDIGQRMFLAVRDNVQKLIKQAGAVRMDKAMSAGAGGDSWDLIACVDRLVELNELREITAPSVAGQDRVFVAPRS